MVRALGDRAVVVFDPRVVVVRVARVVRLPVPVALLVDAFFTAVVRGFGERVALVVLAFRVVRAVPVLLALLLDELEELLRAM